MSGNALSTGAAMSPFNAFLFLQGWKLSRAMCQYREIVEFLMGHSKVEQVNCKLADSPYHALAEKYFSKA